MVSEMKQAMMWFVATVRGPFQSVPIEQGCIRVVVVEDVVAQEVGYLLHDGVVV